MRDQVEAVLADIRPCLQRDGGDVELVGVSDDGVVTLRALGWCAGCPVSLMTLRAGIENTLRERLPAVARVVTVR
jgi:Fe-S cluster biogenesis protein NfuA